MDELKKSLFYEQKNAYDVVDTQAHIAAEAYSRDYMSFLSDCRTEREAVSCAIEMARRSGFEEFIPGMKLHPGSKVFKCNRGKSLILAVIGRNSLEDGIVMAGAHIDSPRLDLKQNPMYENEELCYFRTHYYGGIKKYQWVTIPLELHGVVVLKSGERIDVVIGRDSDEPRFVITDLLPHIAKEQMQKTMAEGITGEGLHLLIGSVPYAGEGKDRVRLAVLSILNDMYGICEEDFLSAELSAVPAFDVCEIGIDRSMIGGYGQDDRVCAYASLKALLDVDDPARTCVCLLADKEETGSEGVTSAKSLAFDSFMEDLCASQGTELRRCYEKSFCLSMDVVAAIDPLYPEVWEKSNDARLNHGIGIHKFTGARGRSGASDASAEVVAYLRRLFSRSGVVFQFCEMGRVDQGGGGTIAKFMANRNIDTIDAGVPLLCMHAPFEVVSKLDCYMTYKGVLAAFSDG